MPTHDLIDDRNEKLVDHINRQTLRYPLQNCVEFPILQRGQERGRGLSLSLDQSA
jgi:hypothetical protein